MNSNTYEAIKAKLQNYSKAYHVSLTYSQLFTFLFTIAILLNSIQSFAQLTFHITQLPENTPDDATIYVVGSFNSWNPEDPSLQFTKNEDGTHSLTSNDIQAGLLEFKFTRGGWPTVEGNENGTFRPNRQFDYDGSQQTLEIQILSWEDLGTGGVLNLPPNVHILDEAFYMPQLDRSRRIWIYLPPDYEIATEKRYRTLYMHDGQNLFMPETSFAGEWEIDESLNELFEQGDEGCIVIGIDNGGSERINEYSPWTNISFGGGQGDEYMEFIVETLKPHIDANYRTQPEREHTSIMGSSMGGLISHYGALEYQEIFGKAGIFSPSYWFSGEAYTHVLASGHQEEMRICLLAGGQEDGGSVAADVETMYQSLLNIGFDTDEVKSNVVADGQHSEWFWAREFKDSYLWMFEVELSTNIEENSTSNLIQFYPNPSNEQIHLQIQHPFQSGKLQIFNIGGQKRYTENLQSTTQKIDVSTLEAGTYFLQLELDGQIAEYEKLVVIR